MPGEIRGRPRSARPNPRGLAIENPRFCAIAPTLRRGSLSLRGVAQSLRASFAGSSRGRRAATGGKGGSGSVRPSWYQYAVLE